MNERYKKIWRSLSPAYTMEIFITSLHNGDHYHQLMPTFVTENKGIRSLSPSYTIEIIITSLTIIFVTENK
jgi:hypothetical protein